MRYFCHVGSEFDEIRFFGQVWTSINDFCGFWKFSKVSRPPTTTTKSAILRNRHSHPHHCVWWSFCAAGKKILRILRPQVFEWNFLAASRPNHTNSWGRFLGTPSVWTPNAQKFSDRYFHFFCLEQLGSIGLETKGGGRSLGVGSITWNPPDGFAALANFNNRDKDLSGGAVKTFCPENTLPNESDIMEAVGKATVFILGQNPCTGCQSGCLGN